MVCCGYDIYNFFFFGVIKYLGVLVFFVLVLVCCFLWGSRGLMDRVGLVTRRSWVRVSGPAWIVVGGSE